MYKDMGYKPKYKRRIGNGSSENTVTVDEEAIQDIARVNPRKEFNLVLEIRALKKILSTYLRAKLDKDNRIRTTYLITGTETGRLASRESVHGTGTNLQNVPKGIARRLFIPDSYKLFVSGDLSQAEARVVAYLAGEDALIRLFESGGDIHRKNASSIFRVQEASVTDKQRQLAKRVVHASNYGMGPITFAKNAGISVQEAKRLLNAYFATYPGIKLWHMATVTRLNKSRMLTTPFGRKRLFMGTYNESLKKVAYAYVPQSTVSDILNTGLLNVYDEISSMDAQILLQVHDSIVVQCLPDDFQRICLIIKNSLERSIKIKGIDGVVRDCRIPCDLQAGWNWDELDTVVSPFNVAPDKHVGGVHGG
jgi:DNA polymerase-1